MTFDLLERSRYGGKPIGLLRLSRGALVERYTTADREIEVGADVYLPLAITRSAIRDSVERAKSQLTLTLPIDAPAAAWWRPFPPSSRVGVTWLAKHQGSTDVIVEWSGRVVQPKFSDTLLTLTCDPSLSDPRSRGMPWRWQKGCPLALYSQGLGMCNVNKALFAVPGTVTEAIGASLRCDAFAAVPAGRLAGGFVEWTRADGEPEKRSIMVHDGDLILLEYGAEDIEEDLEVTAYPGCRHTFADCRDFFENEPNYGGAVYGPDRSAFDGNPV
jgi:hypothetical protein